MNATTVDHPLLGRGARDGAALFREWFKELGAAAEKGDPAAYVFVMGSLVEVIRTFDLPVVFPEINSLQTAVRHVADEYLSEAEDHGFSPDVCGYVKADYALQLRGGEHPMGRIPPPAIGVLTNACNTYLKWAEIWER
ncbi:MAG: 2-hydroxyacyl-CoA dehydratase, partial [Gemmatimonadota bacterium]